MIFPLNLNLRVKLSLALLGSILPIVLTSGLLFLWLGNRQELSDPTDVIYLLAALTTVSVCSIAGTFLIFIHPLLSRIRQASFGAEQLAAGTFKSPLEDTVSDELGCLSRSINQIAQMSSEDAVKLERDKQSLSHQATHDELTGLCNRKHGNETIARLENTVGDVPTSILFLDLDGFKAVNDTCGHAIGDEILVAVSLRLKAILRNDCTLIRWGGDEFVIVLPGADNRGAISIAQDVADLFKQPFATSDGIHKLGCSIGLSTSRPDTSLEQVLEEADSSMYDQKKKRKSVRGEPDQQHDNDTEVSPPDWFDEDWEKAA